MRRLEVRDSLGSLKNDPLVNSLNQIDFREVSKLIE